MGASWMLNPRISKPRFPKMIGILPRTFSFPNGVAVSETKGGKNPISPTKWMASVQFVVLSCQNLGFLLAEVLAEKHRIPVAQKTSFREGTPIIQLGQKRYT